MDDIELQGAEAWTKRLRLFLTRRRQGYIGAPGVATGGAPLGLAMAREVDLERQAGLPIISGRPDRIERPALSMTAPARTR